MMWLACAYNVSDDAWQAVIISSYIEQRRWNNFNCIGLFEISEGDDLDGVLFPAMMQVNAGLMTSGFLSLYVVFLCWSALVSEPLSHHCNVNPRSNRRRDWDTVLSFLLGAFAVVLAIFSTGIDPKSLSFQNEEADTDGEVPYGYGFVHFVLCLGTMYFVMLFMGWDLQPTIQKWTLDFGWATVWVKIINEWFAIGLYVWTMFGPLILQHRDFSWL